MAVGTVTAITSQPSTAFASDSVVNPRGAKPSIWSFFPVAEPHVVHHHRARDDHAHNDEGNDRGSEDHQRHSQVEAVDPGKTHPAMMQGFVLRWCAAGWAPDPIARSRGVRHRRDPHRTPVTRAMGAGAWPEIRGGRVLSWGMGKPLPTLGCIGAALRGGRALL